MPAPYDRFSEHYDRLFDLAERGFLGRWRAEALSLLPANAAILELGSGTGANFAYYPESRLAISSELSAGMLGVARRKARSNHLVQADAQSLPFAVNAFDAVFATLVFCSIPDPLAAFSEAKRVVKPGGRVILLEHVRPPGWKGRAFDVLNFITVPLIDDHLNRRTAELARSAGLSIIDVREKAGGIVNLIIGEVIK